jgi:Fur family transcriptional regulator, ferric uptake regulator
MNKEPVTKELLHSHNLRTTSCRQGILDILGQSGEALSENEIKTQLDSHHDRTTFYRSLKTMLENHIIHKIVVDNQMVKYAINPKHAANSEHVHFYCKQCDKLVCIEDSPVSDIPLPTGFTASETEVIIKGTCQTCGNHEINDY